VFAKSRNFGMAESMTMQGTANKCLIMLALLFVSASWVWGKIMQPAPVYGEGTAAAQAASSVMPYVIGGGIVGFILAIVTVFNVQIARYTAPVYAVCEGFVLGGMSAIFEQRYPGIAVQAVGLTFGTLFCMLAAYKTGLVKVTEKFRMGVISALMAVLLIRVVSWIMSWFGSGIPFVQGTGTFAIGFSLIVVGIAALCLILDFDRLDRLCAMGVPKHMEWYGAFSLMITLIWLYLEMLRLLALLRER
jgi:uncharacterized YccA/Bax inhibitor family protein